MTRSPSEALAAGVVGSWAIGGHTTLVHGGPIGVGVAGIAAVSAAALDEEEDALAERQAAALAAIAIALAVLDGATLFRCTRWAAVAHAPTDDVASMLAHCSLAGGAPARIDVSHPVTLASALLAVALCAGVPHVVNLRARLVLLAVIVGSVVLVTGIAHVAFGVGLESAAAATLASSMVAALFPSVCSRTAAQLVAATALSMGAVIG